MMHVEILPSRRKNRSVFLRVRISGHPRWRKRNGVIFFEVPDELSDWLVIQDQPTDLHDAFARAVVFSAMEAGRDILIHGNVSASLLDGLDVYQKVAASWWPRYRPVRIIADNEVSEDAARHNLRRKEAIQAFSGGLDSIYSLYCHQNGLHGRISRAIPACVFVHGFDIPLSDAAYDGAFRRAERIVAELNSRLIPLRSNLKDFLPPWPQSHPAALAAVLSLFSRRFAEGIIAPSVRYDNPYIHLSGHGSNPVSDHLLSSDSFRVTHDLADKTRVEKTELLCGFPTARRNLRVCWQGEDLSTNCGQCSKCLWQMLCLKAVGCEDDSSFQYELTAQRVAGMHVASQAHLEELKVCHAYAERNGLGRSQLFKALEHVIDDNRALLLPSGVTVAHGEGGGKQKWGVQVIGRLRRLSAGTRRAA